MGSICSTTGTIQIVLHVGCVLDFTTEGETTKDTPLYGPQSPATSREYDIRWTFKYTKGTGAALAGNQAVGFSLVHTLPAGITLSDERFVPENPDFSGGEETEQEASAYFTIAISDSVTTETSFDVTIQLNTNQK